ncbi:MAG: DUF2828 family protein [Oscillospiraceae bacterium]|nr:DUF2828 family protein [Oscillospiraceae bacterium]
MLNFIKDEANRTFTENGAAAYGSTGTDCLDLFAAIGALRSADEEDIRRRFIRAFTENPDLAMKTLFFARDIRGGLGERRVFRICLRWLAENQPASVRKNLIHVSEFGRWDDLLVLLNTPCEQQACELIRRQLEADLVSLEKGEGVSLLAKWLPSVNASNEETVRSARRIARFLGMDERTYRKTLVRLRERIRILENDLRQRNYTFDYSKQPSKAMFKYRKAFFRNDGERYREFLEKVSRGEAGLHADTLMPYELVEPYLDCFGSMRSMSEEEKQALNATWASLPRFGSGENALAVIDTSGSMYMGGKPLPASVALSLGLYFAEHNTGAFRNHFIEFSGRPQLIEIKGDTFADRLCYISSFNEVANTNLEAVFKLILKAAVRHRVPQEELPSALYIISDMEFDSCVADADETVFQNARSTFAAHGYQLPKVIFWNVQSRNLQQPVTWNEQGVALVSGCTPRLFDMVTSGQLSPLQYMLDILGAERYACITA